MENKELADLNGWTLLSDYRDAMKGVTVTNLQVYESCHRFTCDGAVYTISGPYERGAANFVSVSHIPIGATGRLLREMEVWA